MTGSITRAHSPGPPGGCRASPGPGTRRADTPPSGEFRASGCRPDTPQGARPPPLRSGTARMVRKMSCWLTTRSGLFVLYMFSWKFPTLQARTDSRSRLSGLAIDEPEGVAAKRGGKWRPAGGPPNNPARPTTLADVIKGRNMGFTQVCTGQGSTSIAFNPSSGPVASRPAGAFKRTGRCTGRGAHRARREKGLSRQRNIPTAAMI